jgi:hypothetical protein
MRKNLTGLLVSAAAAAFAAPPVFGQTYLPGPPPTVGPIQHQTVEDLPAPTSRTNIGIGEQVNCWIDPSTWQDTDYLVTPYGLVPVQDSMGTVTWSASGLGSVYPLVGNSTTLTADLATASGSVTVSAVVPDSGLLGIDAPINLALAFAVFIPNGIQALSVRDDRAFGTAPPPENVIGFRSYFTCQVLPTIVNFRRVNFRENKPGDNWTWPNNTPGSTMPSIEPYNVGNQGGQVNITIDTISSGGYPIEYLSAADYFSYTIRVPSEYQAAGGGWVSFFLNETHDKIYYRPADGQAVFNGSNELQGGTMGPWRSIP